MRFRVFQAMWGMEGLAGDRRHWSIERQVDAIKAAGFDGAGIEIPKYDVARAYAGALHDAGLDWTMECFPTAVADLEPIIEAVHEFGRDHCDHMNLQANIRLANPLDAIPYVLGWQEQADQAGIPLYFETHRDRLTTDLLFTLQLIDAVPPLRLTADLSHFLVAREFRWPMRDEDQALIDRILERSWAFHGRVASREQIQIPIQFPQHRHWLELFLHWWKLGFESWRSRAGPDDTLIFTTELGPPPYAITGSDGAELSDRWLEAVHIKDLMLDLWASLEALDTDDASQHSIDGLSLQPTEDRASASDGA